MDQGCAYGNRPIMMVYDGDQLDVVELSVPNDLYFVIVDLDHYEGWKVERLCQQLYGAQVPFAFIPVGHTYDDFGIEPGRLQAFRAVIAATPVELLTDGDRAAIQAVADDIAVLSPKQATPDALAELSPFDVWGPDGIYLLPRVKRDPNTRTLVCHLLNRVDREGDEPLRYVSFMVRRDAWLGDKLTGATLHRPGEEALPLEVEILSDGARAIVPRLPIWAIAELTFE